MPGADARDSVRPRRPRVDLRGPCQVVRVGSSRAHPLARAAKVHSRAPRPTGVSLPGALLLPGPTYMTEEAALLLLAIFCYIFAA